MPQQPWPSRDQPRVGTRVEYDVSTVTDTVILAAVAGQKARILRGWLHNLSTTTTATITFIDSAGDISKDFRIPAEGKMFFGYDATPADFYESDTAGSALSVDQDTAVQVIGEFYVEYWSTP